MNELIYLIGLIVVIMTAALGDRAQAEGKLDASYTISFARIRVGDIAATGVFGERNTRFLRVAALVAS